MHFIRIKKERHGLCRIARLSNNDNYLLIECKKISICMKVEKIKAEKIRFRLVFGQLSCKPSTSFCLHCFLLANLLLFNHLWNNTL